MHSQLNIHVDSKYVTGSLIGDATTWPNDS